MTVLVTEKRKIRRDFSEQNKEEIKISFFPHHKLPQNYIFAGIILFSAAVTATTSPPSLVIVLKQIHQLPLPSSSLLLPSAAMDFVGSCIRSSGEPFTLIVSTAKDSIFASPRRSSTALLFRRREKVPPFASQRSNGLGFQCRVALDSHASSSPTEVKMNDDDDFASLTALSPLDGRYSSKVKELCHYFSEYGLIRYRVFVEVKWLLNLSRNSEIPEVPNFSEDAVAYLERISNNFSLQDAARVKEIEKVTNHDVKAVEYFLKERCQDHPEIAKVNEFFHFACTSEDINNLSYALMLKEALNQTILPAMVELCEAIYSMSKEYAWIPMLSRTHGQTASPTTLGKEMLIFASRLSKRGRKFPGIKIEGKFAGAVGNYNAHIAAYPDIDWPKTSEDFVNSLGIYFNPYVTQIEPHDYIAEIFDVIRHFNKILVDFNRDIWSYVSLGYFKQVPKAGEIGSSTMPHKVNPIDFENSEGNLSLANSVLHSIGDKLVISRMQRDLTDSTVLRNLGVGLGYSLIAYKSALQGIQKLQVNEARLHGDLDNSWEVLAEPIQTVMRRHGIPQPYEKLKELTRGRSVSKESIREFIEKLDLPEEAKSYLLTLTPHSYIGAAARLAEAVDPSEELRDGFKIV